jgi:hypothetical protein
VAVENGYFTVQLEVDGAGAALDPAWFAESVWVGLAVDGQPELQPRQALTHVPAALSAETARRVRVTAASGACDEGEIVWDPNRGNLAVCESGLWRSVGTVIVIDLGGYRGWSNGRYASSCHEYRNPPAGVLYEGSTGDGVYRIDPDGLGGEAPVDVWCDQTTDGGGWTLLGTIAGGDAHRWNTQYGYWSDQNALGSAAAPHNVDHKSKAWWLLDVTGGEVMFERWYDGQRRAQGVLSNACLHGRSRFVDLFTTNDNGLRCGTGSIRIVTPAASQAGVASGYREGVDTAGLDGSDTNGFCWNGGDNNSNTFRGHAGWNQSDYSTCVAAGHLGYIGVWQNGDSQFQNHDITTTNWLWQTDVTRTAISLYAR